MVRRLVALVVGGAVLVVVLAVTAVVVGVALLRGGGRRSPTSASPASEAGCDDVVRDPGKGIATHVGPGTSEPDRVVVEYDTVPPSSGPHLPVPLYPAAPFYDVADAPVVEQLVHNLEHGYTLVWYDTDLPADQVDDLRTVADLAREDPATGGKLVVVPGTAATAPCPPTAPSPCRTGPPTAASASSAARSPARSSSGSSRPSPPPTPRSPTPPDPCPLA